MEVTLQHDETKEVIVVKMVASNGVWLMAKDGYSYDLRHWRKL